MSTKELANELLLAEEQVVGSILYKSEDASNVSSILTEENFLDYDYKTIFKAILTVLRSDVEPGIIEVKRVLESEGNLAKVGGTSRLESLRERGREFLRVSTSITFAKYLKELSAKNLANSILEEAREDFSIDSGKTFMTAISDVQSKLNEEVSKMSSSSTVATVAEYSEFYMDVLQERQDSIGSSKSGLIGIPTLIPTLDKVTGGYQPGWLVTVTARTGVGKSIIAVMTAGSAGMAGMTVLFFSLEMSKQEIVDRLVALISGVDQSKLKNGRVNEEEKTRVKEALEIIKTMNIIIDEVSQPSIDYVRSKCAEQAQKPEGLDMVILDYIQILSPPPGISNREQQVAFMSRNLKGMAKSFGVPFIVLAQLNRKKVNGGDESSEEDGGYGIPTLDEIRESGAIAQDSDLIIIIHRESTDDENIPHTFIKVAKHRHGANGAVIRCFSNLGCSMFQEIERHKKKNVSDFPEEPDFNNTPVSEENTESSLYVDSGAEISEELSDEWGFGDSSDNDEELDFGINYDEFENPWGDD